jgi:hypothetical protein
MTSHWTGTDQDVYRHASAPLKKPSPENRNSRMDVIDVIERELVIRRVQSGTRRVAAIRVTTVSLLQTPPGHKPVDNDFGLRSRSCNNGGSKERQRLQSEGDSSKELHSAAAPTTSRARTWEQMSMGELGG